MRFHVIRILTSLILVTGACGGDGPTDPDKAIDPKLKNPMTGSWQGTATPSAGSTISVDMTLLATGEFVADGNAVFTPIAGPTGKQIYKIFNAVVTHVDSVSVQFENSDSQAFFFGRVSGSTMTGKVSGGGFPFTNGGTQITLTRK
jgi:hypothetical protein